MRSCISTPGRRACLSLALSAAPPATPMFHRYRPGGTDVPSWWLPGPKPAGDPGEARLFIYDFRHHDCPGTRSRQDRRGARQLPQPRGRARHHAGLAVLFPQALLLARGKRRPGRAAAGMRTAGLRGRGRPGHRAPRPPGQPGGRLGPRGLDHGRERLRRLRPALRRPGLQRAVQGDRRLHPARPAADRRPRRGPGHRPPPQLGQRGPGPGRLAGAGHAVRLRRHRRRPVPAGHPGTRRRDPHRHAHRLDRGEPRRRGGGRGQRGGGP